MSNDVKSVKNCLFDKTFIDTEVASTYMHLALSKGSDALFSAQWVEGFLNGSGLLLIYNENLWLRQLVSSFFHSGVHQFEFYLPLAEYSCGIFLC